MSGAAASALEAVLEGWCAKSRCHNCSEEIVISQWQGEENDAQSFYAIIPKIMPSPNKFNRDVAHCVSANQMCRQPLSVNQLYCQQKYSSHTWGAAVSHTAAPQLNREAVYGLMYLM